MSASRTTKHEPRYTALLAAAQFVAIERESAIAQAHHHLVQMLGHLRAAHHYVSTHGIDLALPSQTDLAELVSICARIAQEHATHQEKTE